MEAFDGVITVRHVRYASEATGWGVLDARTESGEGVTVVGAVAHLEERERLQVSGEWVEDPRYGRQLKVSRAEPLPPEDPAAVVDYLRRVRHIGARRAERLIERYGTGGVLEAIDADPQQAFTSAGLAPRSAREAAESWEDLRLLRRLHLMLAPHGLAYLSSRIADALGPRAATVVAENPYALTSVFGVGFTLADRIARGAGAPLPPGERARAALLHVLREAERDGSTCLPRPRVLAAAAELLGEEPPAEAVPEAVAAGDLVEEEANVYRAPVAALEAELAERVTSLLGAPPDVHEERLRRVVAEVGSGLTQEQAATVESAFANRLSLITGGPGTGKTSTIRALVAAATKAGLRPLLLAPTGRAAARMTEATGAAARTLHSALGWIPGEAPAHNAEEPLRCELLILDESSMANLEMLVTLLRAVDPQRTRVVLVGDADQLAPVGAGKPFAELVATALVPLTCLTRIFRQAAGSMIVQAAHRVRAGRLPDLRPQEGMRRDLFLLERPDPVAARAEIVDLVARRLPGHYEVDPVRDIQVFAPVYRGELGIDALNQALREALNPDGRSVRGGRLRAGDKLMMTGRNLHELGLMNGTLLRLLDEVDDEEEPALLLSAEETPFRLPLREAERLRLAYACSVHRGQGIELPIAVIVAHPAAGAFFLRREMLYTALTRATTATVIVGTLDSLGRAVSRTDTARRFSRLGPRLTRLVAAAAD